MVQAWPGELERADHAAHDLWESVHEVALEPAPTAPTPSTPPRVSSARASKLLNEDKRQRASAHSSTTATKFITI
jgi:hypothetical protein